VAGVVLRVGEVHRVGRDDREAVAAGEVSRGLPAAAGDELHVEVGGPGIARDDVGEPGVGRQDDQAGPIDGQLTTEHEVLVVVERRDGAAQARPPLRIARQQHRALPRGLERHAVDRGEPVRVGDAAEIHRAPDAVRVGERERGHAPLDGGGRQRLERRRARDAAQPRVRRVDVQMNEIVGQHHSVG